MAARSKDMEADLAPGDEPVRAEYERDFYSWSLEQARLIREGRAEALDRDNLAEEIELQAREQFNKLVGALRVAMLHMLKWDHQPARRSRSWMLSIKQARLDIADVLDDNPGSSRALPKRLAALTAAPTLTPPRRPDWTRRNSRMPVPIRSPTSRRGIFRDRHQA